MNQTTLPSDPDWSKYRLPAEWERHEATFLAWPHNAETWPGLLEAVQQTYLDIIRALLPGEKVILLATDCGAAQSIQERLEKEKIPSENLQVVTIPNDDAWVRDSGPIFMLRRDSGNPRRIAHDFIFNSWGRKYGPWDKDDVIPLAACRMTDTPCFRHDFVLEGGSLDTDGLGTLLTTEQCLLNPNRNSSHDRKAIEGRLAEWLGIRKIIWLNDGLEGDDTDGHIDDITRFLAPGVVVTVVEPDTRDANHAPLQSLNFPCLRVWTVPIIEIRPAMRTSTSEIQLCWFLFFNPQPIRWSSISFGLIFPGGRWLESTAKPW
ncbi:agmatine deiminase family protein [bacterium]|nr:agmatine deiminase family protein [bacterium]